MGISQQNSMNAQDWKEWGKDVFKFFIPTILAMLYVLSSSPNISKQTLWAALGAGYSSLVISLISLVQQYRKGN